MTLKSTADRYGAVAVTIHWASVVLILFLIVSGLRAADMADPVAKTAILRLHVPAGLTVLALTILRVIWWWMVDRKPAPASGSPRWQERGARAVHLLFYVIVLLMAASGIAMMALSGAGSIVLGGSAAPLPDFANYAPHLPHGVGARLLMLLLVLHVGAALYHHFVRRDGLLRRMWFGRRPAARA